jgi:gas vesicle protein
MSERDDFGSFLLGFVIGGLTGAALALLLAPQSGEETRTLIKEKTIELKDKATETIDETYARAEEAAAEARLRAEELAKLARERAEEFQKRGQVVLEEQKGKLSEAVSTAKKSVSKVAGSKTETEKPA